MQVDISLSSVSFFFFKHDEYAIKYNGIIWCEGNSLLKCNFWDCSLHLCALEPFWRCSVARLNVRELHIHLKSAINIILLTASDFSFQWIWHLCYFANCELQLNGRVYGKQDIYFHELWDNNSSKPTYQPKVLSKTLNCIFCVFTGMEKLCQLRPFWIKTPTSAKVSHWFVCLVHALCFSTLVITLVSCHGRSSQGLT